MGKFLIAAKTDDIPSGQGKTVFVGGKQIAVFNLDGAFYAIRDACTHQGAPLSGGHVSGQSVTCSWHGAKFDITTGQALSRVAFTPVPCYKVRIAGEDLEIEI